MLRARGLSLNLGAQALDVDVESLGVANVIGAPNAIDELPEGQHAARIAQQVLQQIKLFERHR